MDDSKSGQKSVEFSVPDESEASGHSKRSRPRLSNTRSSFFKNLSRSFRRSNGERGADIETLRGTHGPDFESLGIISRPGGQGCGCFGRKEAKERIILIKGPFLFVFSDENDTSPKYAISLAHMKAKKQNETVVSLETNLGDIEYEVTFDKESDAKEFAGVARKQAAVGEADIVRKRLGHEHLLKKRASVRYAEKVAMKKVEDQPEKPENITADDMAQINTMAGY